MELAAVGWSGVVPLVIRGLKSQIAAAPTNTPQHTPRGTDNFKTPGKTQPSPKLLQNAGLALRVGPELRGRKTF